MSASAPRVLIVRLGALGDVIHAIPAAAALRARYPEARIDWMVDPRYVSIVDLVDGVDRAIPFDARAGLMAVLAAIRGRRRERYDVAIDLQGLVKSAVLARAVGARRTVGFARPLLREPLAALFYTEVSAGADGEHVIAKNLRLLERLDVRSPRVAFPLRRPETRADVTVAERAGTEGYVLINPGAAWPNKRWPPERFGTVAAGVHRRTGMRSVVLWGPGEDALAGAVVEAAKGAAVAASATTIPELFAIARGARLMISGDTGPLHVAGAVGTPIVALFGPTNPARNGPWAAADIALSRVEGCACVYQRRCRRAVPCINDIDVQDVIDAAMRRLGLDGGRDD